MDDFDRRGSWVGVAIICCVCEFRLLLLNWTASGAVDGLGLQTRSHGILSFFFLFFFLLLCVCNLLEE